MMGISSNRVRFGQTAAVPQALAAKPIAFSTDLDSTYLPYDSASRDFNRLAIADNNRAVRQERPHLAVLANTGRGLTSTKQAGPVLKGMPLDMLSTNNGQELFINWQGERTDRWLAGLTPADADPFWGAHLRQTYGWDIAQVLGVMRQTYANAGFVPLASNPIRNGKFDGTQAMVKTLPDGERLVLRYYADQPAFTLGLLTQTADADGNLRYGEACPPAVMQQAAALAKTIRDTLDGQGLQTGLYRTVVENGDNRAALHALTPNDVSKATVLDGLKRFYLPGLQGVITAGDSPYNDAEMLTAQTYGKAGETIPNYPILSGEQPRMQALLAGHPHLVQVREGWLGPGIQQQTRRILDLRA